MKDFIGTNGPWVADKTSRAIGPISKEDDQSYGMVIPVAWVEFDPEVEVQAANAQLIAAAPELLYALQMLKAELVLSDVDLDYIESHFRPHIDRARDAIHKALGK